MPATASDLLDTFEASVREGLDEFMLPRGASYESGFSRFEGQPRKLKARSDGIPGLFWYICRYSFPTMYLDMGFGDRESLVEAMVGYPTLGLEHHPGILAEAVGRNEGGLSGRAWVIELPFMRTTVEELTSRLKSIWDLLESPSEHVFDRAQQILGRRLIFAQQEQRHRDRQRDTIQASTAFHEGNFSRAVELLSRYERDDEFTEANKKMLALAKKKGERDVAPNT
jgi:hypothetical protein